jgi:hypothetical protein
MNILFFLFLSQVILNNINFRIKENKLPGLFEVFPEIKNLWPIWIRKKGQKIKCIKDEDCLFPQACCHHPIIPGEKFCCSGNYKKRQMKYAFIYNYVKNIN